MELLWSMNHTDNACANYPLFLTGALQEILYLNPPPYLGNPPHILETVQGSQKIPPQGPKKWPTWPQKKAFLRHTHKKYILQKKWPKRAICGLSSGQNNLPPPIWGHGHQLDDRHRNPNNNTREIIWLGNQLFSDALVSLGHIQHNYSVLQKHFVNR